MDGVIWDALRLAVTYDDDLEYESVSIEAVHNAQAAFLEVQCSLDEDDRDMGYCLVTSTPQPSTDIASLVSSVVRHRNVYGGVLSCEIDRSNMTCQFDDRAQSVLGLPAELTVRLSEATEGDRVVFREKLRTLLEVGYKGVVPTLLL